MAFVSRLRESLQIRESQVPSEFTRGDSLERVLDRHLLAVEQMAEDELITSILLLSPDRTRLFHGAGPNLPQSYREAIDGSEIGPQAGSCGTAAYLGQPIYVPDIATDPLWAAFRHIALPHGLRACWSTPIRDTAGSILGTFAIYHRDAGLPTQNEIEAIELITDLVAQAILWARGEPERPRLKLVSDNETPRVTAHWPDRLLRNVQRLERITADLERHAEAADSEETRIALKRASEDCRKLVSTIRLEVERNGRSVQ